MEVSIKDIKSVYIETGRLNRNVIEKEIAISWYKCKLQTLHPGDSIKRNFIESKCNFENSFLNFIDSIIDNKFQYVLANKNLNVCHSRLIDSTLKQINSIDDLFIGTNAGYIANKLKLNYQVKYHEHFLDVLSSYCTYGIYLSNGNLSYGTLTLISKDEITNYEVIKIIDNLNKYYRKEDFDVMPAEENKCNTELLLSELFNYEPNYFKNFHNNINRLNTQMNIILIKGTSGSGKTTLCQYLAMRKEGVIGYSDAKELNNMLQEQYILRLLSQNDTVIIENIERLNESILNVLTVYIEGIITQKTPNNYSDFRCKNLILSTVYTDRETNDFISKYKAYTKLMSKLSLCTVNLVNSNSLKEECNTFAKRIVEMRRIKASSSFIKKVAEDLEQTDFKTAVKNVEESLRLPANTDLEQVRLHINDHNISTKTLEEHELDYILKVYKQFDENIAATAEVLGIGRSTLYRKLEKRKSVSK